MSEERPGRTARKFYQHLRSLAFEPATVIDVGVAWGTPELYEAFPNAYYYLFEALPSFETPVRNALKRLRGEYHMVALANEVGEQTIYVGQEPIRRAGASIFHTEKGPTSEAVTVQLRRMDDLIVTKPLATPALLKVDAQGSDIEVLRGGAKTVAQCDVVVVETGLHPFRNADNQTHKVINHMSSLGFATYDFLSALERPYDNALGQIDVVFVRENGPFRRHAFWA